MRCKRTHIATIIVLIIHTHTHRQDFCLFLYSFYYKKTLEFTTAHLSGIFLWLSFYAATIAFFIPSLTLFLAKMSSIFVSLS